MEVVLVELSDETRHVAVFEMLGKDRSRKFFTLRNQELVFAFGHQELNDDERTSTTTNVSPSLPHRATS